MKDVNIEKRKYKPGSAPRTHKNIWKQEQLPFKEYAKVFFSRFVNVSVHFLFWLFFKTFHCCRPFAFHKHIHMYMGIHVKKKLGGIGRQDLRGHVRYACNFFSLPWTGRSAQRGTTTRPSFGIPPSQRTTGSATRWRTSSNKLTNKML